MIGSAEIGEIMMRAFILRRVGLIDEGRAGSTLIGTPGTPDLARIEGFSLAMAIPTRCSILRRTRRPRLDRALRRAPTTNCRLMFARTGQVLRRPTDAEAGACLGITPELDAENCTTWPLWARGLQGLATAVYAASEGLSVSCSTPELSAADRRARQRASRTISAFPPASTAWKLPARAFNQALKFGAEMAIPLEVAQLDCGGQASRSCRTDAP